MSLFYVLFETRKGGKPYMMGKLYAPSKEKAIENFFNTFIHSPKDWYTDKEKIDFVRTPEELTDQEKEWLKKGVLL